MPDSDRKQRDAGDARWSERARPADARHRAADERPRRAPARSAGCDELRDPLGDFSEQTGAVFG